MHSPGFEVERLGRGEIDPRLRLVVAGDLGPEDRIPGQVVRARQVDHQRDVAVRHRRQEEAGLQPRHRARHLGPGREHVPGEVERPQGLLAKIGDAEARQDALQVAPMQHVELRERHAPRPHLLHGGLVLAAPGIGEGWPIEGMAERRQDALALAGDAGAPVDEGAEDVEEQGLWCLRHAAKLPGRALKSRAGAYHLSRRERSTRRRRAGEGSRSVR